MTEQNHTIWQNATLHLCTDLDTDRVINNGTLVTGENKILWVGPVDQLPNKYKNNGHLTYDLAHAVVTPGLIDCHTHVIYGGNRANEFKRRLEGERYEDILAQGGGIYSTVRATRATDEARLYSSALQRVRQFIRNGVTSFEVKSGYGLDLENETKMLRVARKLTQSGLDVRATFLGAHVRAPEYDNNHDYIDYLVNVVLPAVADNKLADAIDAFCDTIAFSKEELEPLMAAANRHGLKCKIHTDQLSTSGGAECIAPYQALSADHLEYTNDQQLQLMKKSGMVAVLLPGAFYYLQESQKPNVQKLREFDIPIALATDCNPGSSPCLSLLSILNMACVLFRMTPFEALKAVTRHAAKALDWSNEKGQLQVGYDADFVVWDVKQFDELVYYFGGNPCSKVIKKGSIIYERSETV